MLEAFLSFVMMATASWVLVTIANSSILIAVMICGIALIVVECLPEPLNVFKFKDILFGILGILAGIYMAGWRPQ